MTVPSYSIVRLTLSCLPTSAGKTFSVTGWKVGWVIGPARLVKGVITTNQFVQVGGLPMSGCMTVNPFNSSTKVQFSVSTPSQQAIAWCLEEVKSSVGDAL